MSAPVVEILYFEGCPHHECAFQLVARLARELGIEPDVRLVHVLTTEEATKQRFLGSPTIRVEGVDVEPGADERTVFMLACRVYRTDSGLVGQPDEAWVREALTRAA